MRTALLTLTVGSLLAAGLAVPAPASAAPRQPVVTGLGWSERQARPIDLAEGEQTRGGPRRSAGSPTTSASSASTTPPRRASCTASRPGAVYRIDDDHRVADHGRPQHRRRADRQASASTSTRWPNALRVVSDTGQNLRHSSLCRRPLRHGRRTLNRAHPPCRHRRRGLHSTATTTAATGTQLFDVDAPSSTRRRPRQTRRTPASSSPVGPLATSTSPHRTGFDVYTEQLPDGTTRNIALLSDRDDDGTRRLHRQHGGPAR